MKLKFNPKLIYDRTIASGSWLQILMLIVITALAFVVVGSIITLLGDSYIIYPKSEEQTPKWWQLYYYFISTGSQASLEHDNTGWSRIIAALLSFLGAVFMSGMLISTISNLFRVRVDRIRNGRIYYKFKSHVVIIGSDRMIQGILRQVCADPTVHKVVIMTAGNINELRDELKASLPSSKERSKVVVCYGNRKSALDLERIHIASAREVYLLGDDSEFDRIENYHDSLNVHCLRLIAEICKKHNRKDLPCYVSFDYKTTYHVFQYVDLPSDLQEYLIVNPFNFNEFWAQNVLVTNSDPESQILYQPLDYRPITLRDSDDYVHFIIIGLSKAGQAMALQAAHIAHYPNYKRHKTRITIIDTKMREEMNEFKQKCGELFALSHSEFIDADRWVKEDGAVKDFTTQYHINKSLYGHLITDNNDPDFIDIEWTFINGSDNNPRVRELLIEYANDPNAMVTVAVCLNKTHTSLRTAMHLPKIYYEKQIPVLVQQRKTPTIVKTLYEQSEDEDRYFSNTRPFGMVNDCFNVGLAMSVRYCKRINAAYKYYIQHGVTPDSIDDNQADKLWREVPITKRWSNIYAACSIPTKLRCAGYTPGQYHDIEFNDAQLHMLSEIEHNRWNVEELLLGYRPVTCDEDALIDADKSLKNSFKKRYIHYDIRPFDGLKVDANGIIASSYDEIIVKALPVIINDSQSRQ